MIDDYRHNQLTRQMLEQQQQRGQMLEQQQRGKRKAEAAKPKPPKRPQSKNKMRPTLTISLRDRITDIVETRTEDAREMSFEEKAIYLKLIMENFKKNFHDKHPNKEDYCKSQNFEENYEFVRHIESGGLFKEFEALDAFLTETDEGSD